MSQSCSGCILDSDGKDAKSSSGSILQPVSPKDSTLPEAPSQSLSEAEPPSISGILKDDFVAPQFRKDRAVVVEASELEIAAAIVVLKKRSVHFGNPKEVDALPFNPREGWRQAALNFIRQNQSEAAKGHGTFI